MTAHARAAPVHRKEKTMPVYSKTGDDRRQDQGKVNHAIEDGFPPETAAGQKHGDADGEGQADDHGNEGYAQAEADCRPFRIA
jgi:hypothetical protein